MEKKTEQFTHRRTKIRIFSFVTALILVLCGFLLESQLMLAKNKQELEYTYMRALNDLIDYVSDMEYTLKKSGYVSTATLRGDISAELLEQSSGAKAAMAVLPFSQEKTERISRFISQIGDYSLALSRKASSGQEIDEEDFANLSTMEEYAVALSQSLQEVQMHLSAQKAEIGRTQRLLNNIDTFDNVTNFDDTMDEVAQKFSEYPSLLYDGPFSDHILQKEALYLKGKQTVTKQQAAEKAAEFLDCAVSDLTESGTVENKLAAYVFTYDSARVNVTKIGGEISYFMKTADYYDSKLSYSEALDKALAFLDELGISSVKESYFVENDNMCTINFSYLTEDEPAVICYPDLLKVTVELNEGRIVEYDATGYLMNHREREIAEPKISLEEAQDIVSAALTVDRTSLAIIPTSGQDEVLCYEFGCHDKDGTDILLYINVETGYEEQLFILTYSDQGILAR